jgi:hypothetical protein
MYAEEVVWQDELVLFVHAAMSALGSDCDNFATRREN